MKPKDMYTQLLCAFLEGFRRTSSRTDLPVVALPEPELEFITMPDHEFDEMIRGPKKMWRSAA